MTAEQRNRVRAAIDRRTRELVRERGNGCISCGADRDSTTKGCKSCTDRAAGRRRRAKP